MRVYLGFSLVAAVCLTPLAFAQERREEKGDERAAPAIRREAKGAPHAAWSSDQQIAALLFGCARNEVEISTLAEEKATSEEVKAFAAMMVKDHSPGLEKLKELAGPLLSAHASDTPVEAVKEETKEETKEEVRDPAAKEVPATPRLGRREGAEPRRRVTVKRANVDEEPAAHALDWNNIHMQIADQCLTKAEFSKKSGAEFDRCYMGQQIMAHAKALDELKVLRNYASPELRKDIDETTKMATHHLDEAKTIVESLMKGEAKEQVSRKPKDE
jgi:predicted outer membrane protein